MTRSQVEMEPVHVLIEIKPSLPVLLAGLVTTLALRHSRAASFGVRIVPAILSPRAGNLLYVHTKNSSRY
jgi:hypothetical protein